jgi:hypothetical protein
MRFPTRGRNATLSVLLSFSIPLLLVAADIFVDKGGDFLAWGAPQWKVWCTGFLWDLSAWAAFMVALAALRRSARPGVRRAAAWLCVASAAVHSLAIAISAGYHAVFHHLPNIHALEFAINEWRNAWGMFQDALDAKVLAWFALSVPALSWLHLAALRRWSARFDIRPTWPRRAAIAAPFLVALGVSSFALGWHRFQEPLPLGAAWSRVFFQYGLQAFGNRTDLQRPVRMEIPPPQRTPAPFNILVILHESLRSDALTRAKPALMGAIDAEAVAPRSLRWQSDSLTWVFPLARANATATAVSVSSWTTGVPPWGSTYRLHRSPTIFDAAHALGRRTFLVTAQDWHWWHLDEFFFGPSLQRIADRSAFDAPRVNDVGVDDALLVDRLAEFASESKTPFTAILQFNGTHGPYWVGPHGPDLPLSSRERYLAAVRYVDSVQDACLARLESLGILENTLVIVFSDHAESLNQREIARINDFHEEAVRVPFWIRLPRTGLDIASVRPHLDAWTSRAVDLLDVAPTLLDAMGFDRDHVARSLHAGSSLIAPPPDTERVLGGQSTGDVRSWDIEGCFVLRGPMKFTIHGKIGPRLHDLSVDPLETTDLWTDPVKRAAALSWLRPAFAEPGRAALCRRAGVDCPEELRDLDRRATTGRHGGI